MPQICQALTKGTSCTCFCISPSASCPTANPCYGWFPLPRSRIISKICRTLLQSHLLVMTPASGVSLILLDQLWEKCSRIFMFCLSSMSPPHYSHKLSGAKGRGIERSDCQLSSISGIYKKVHSALQVHSAHEIQTPLQGLNYWPSSWVHESG